MSDFNLLVWVERKTIGFIRVSNQIKGVWYFNNVKQMKQKYIWSFDSFIWTGNAYEELYS